MNKAYLLLPLVLACSSSKHEFCDSEMDCMDAAQTFTDNKSCEVSHNVEEVEACKEKRRELQSQYMDLLNKEKLAEEKEKQEQLEAIIKKRKGG